jgi:hypothetical protein
MLEDVTLAFDLAQGPRRLSADCTRQVRGDQRVSASKLHLSEVPTAKPIIAEDS